MADISAGMVPDGVATAAGDRRKADLAEIEAQLATGAAPHASEIDLPAGFQNDGNC